MDNSKRKGIKILINQPTSTKILQSPYLENKKNIFQNIVESNYNSKNNEDVKVTDLKNDFFQFSFPDPEIPYKIMAAQNDKLTLDVTTIDKPEEQLQRYKMIIWEYHGGPNQHFYFRRVEQNKYFIINAATGFVVEVPSQSIQNQTQLQVNPPQRTVGQVWELVTCGRNLYQFRSFCGKVMDVSSHWIRNGSPIIQFENNNGKNQKWKIVPA